MDLHVDGRKLNLHLSRDIFTRILSKSLINFGCDYFGRKDGARPVRLEFRSLYRYRLTCTLEGGRTTMRILSERPTTD